MAEISTQNLTDHDLLIRLDTRMAGLENEMRLIRDGTHDDIKELKEKKLDRQEFIDFKMENEKTRTEKITDFAKSEASIKIELEKQSKKIDFILRIVWMGLGILGAIELIAPFLVRYYLGT